MVGEGWVDGSRWTEWEEQAVELLEKKNVGYNLDDGWLAKRWSFCVFFVIASNDSLSNEDDLAK